MRLFHFSENPNIAEFIPRPPLARPEVEPLIWAMDEERSPIYFLPRECPRVCFWVTPETNKADRELYECTVSGRMVIAIEFGWLDRVREATLYRYEFSPEGFEPLTKSQTESYGAYVSRSAVMPLRVEPMGDLLNCLRDSGVELRLCPDLHSLATTVAASTLHFSLIRLRNCSPNRIASAVAAAADPLG